MSAQSLDEDKAKQHVANTSGENEGRILSPSQREALQMSGRNYLRVTKKKL
jgi:conjugal transfer mating pair stabilization protein TraG